MVDMDLFSFFYLQLPSLTSTFVDEALFSPVYVFSFVVKNWVPIMVRISQPHVYEKTSHIALYTGCRVKWMPLLTSFYLFYPVQNHNPRKDANTGKVNLTMSLF